MYILLLVNTLVGFFLLFCFLLLLDVVRSENVCELSKPDIQIDTTAHFKHNPKSENALEEKEIHWNLGY